MQKTKADITGTKRISVAFETNGKGFIGFIVQLPGAYVRGKTEEEALSKVGSEVQSYAKWLGAGPPVRYEVLVSQRHPYALTVEDADSEILLEEDKSPMNDRKFMELHDYVKKVAEHIEPRFSLAGWRLRCRPRPSDLSHGCVSRFEFLRDFFEVAFQVKGPFG